MQKDVHIEVFSTHFMDKVIKDGIDSVLQHFCMYYIFQQLFGKDCAHVQGLY